MIVKKLLVFSLCFLEGFTWKSCGIANSKVKRVYEGLNEIETYPWLGFLYYKFNLELYTTAVVLVTRQIVLATASEIDVLPKKEFRAHARVVLGHTCTGESIGIREYTYHPDYTKTSMISAICIIQLETDVSTQPELRPICAPPQHFTTPIFYAMVPSNSCLKSKLMIYKMIYVPLDECKSYYRRNGLDIESFWPAKTVCAKSLAGGKCVWRSGAILTVKIRNRWRLLGFGVYGPGCEAPARFLDYGQYHKWVRQSIARIGRPSVTIIDENHIIMRRMSSHIQRFGNCDYEETISQVYSDNFTIHSGSLFKVPNSKGFYKYNMSLFENIEYSCIVLKASNYNNTMPKPNIRLRKWCPGNRVFCSDYDLLSIHFYVEIEFFDMMFLVVQIYGTEVKKIDVHAVMALGNKRLSLPLIYPLKKLHKIMTFNEFKIQHLFLPMYVLRNRPTNIARTLPKIGDTRHYKNKPVYRRKYPIPNRGPNVWPPATTNKRHFNYKVKPITTTDYNGWYPHKANLDIDWYADIEDPLTGSLHQSISTKKPYKTTTTFIVRPEKPVIERPLVTAERPIVTAEKPDRIASRPVIKFQRPVVTYKIPVIITEVPIEITKTHILTTTSPIITTKRPEGSVLSTNRPVKTTKESVITTKKPVKLIKKINITTERPVKFIKKLNVTTKRPIGTTKRPFFTTETPVVTLGGPIRTTYRPADVWEDYPPDYPPDYPFYE